MLILAALNYILQDLRSYPAIYGRLKPEVQLRLIKQEEAKIWAARYLIHARENFLNEHTNKKKEMSERELLVSESVPDDKLLDSALFPLTPKDVQEAFDNVKLRNNMARPGEFLGELNCLFDKKVTVVDDQ